MELLSLVHFHVPQRQTRSRQLLKNRSKTNVGRNTSVARMGEHINKYVLNLNVFVISLFSFKNVRQFSVCEIFLHLFSFGFFI